METTISEVEDLLGQNNGSMVYLDLYNSVSSNAQRNLYPALRIAKRQQRLTLVNLVDPDTKLATFIVALPLREEA